MYKFHYDFMKKKCKKCILLFTDTDSLCYEIDEDFYEIMHQHKEFFDLSNQPKDSKYYCNIIIVLLYIFYCQYKYY